MSERFAIVSLLRLVVAVALIAGAAAISWRQYETSPMLDDRHAEELDVVDVREVDFDGAFAIVVTVDEIERLAVRAQRAGRVTYVATDSTVMPGDLLLRIDDEPVVAFVGEAPLVDDVLVGSSGTNVDRALQFLSSLDLYSGDADGVAGSAFAAAAERFNQRYQTGTDGLRQSNTAWIGDNAEGAEIEKTVSVGDVVQEGDTVALGPVVRAVATIDEPDRVNPLLRGASVVGVVDDHEVRYLPGSRSLDVETTAALADQVPEGEPLRISLALPDPLLVVAVPPSAVIAGDTDEMCVVDGSSQETVLVDLLGEEPGVAFIDPAGAPTRVVANPWTLEREITCPGR